MRRITLILGVSFFTLIASFGMAQENCTFELSGFVLDAHNEKPLPDSKVHIKELKITVEADDSGFYTISGLCEGRYEVFCKHIGCDAIKDTIWMTGSVSHNFYPEHHLEFSAVQVAVKKENDGSLKPEMLSEKELKESRGLSLGDGLSKLNGVSTLSTGNNITKPVIHGMHSNRILILNNGIRQEGQQWGNEHAPEIDPFIASDLAVVKGANSVQYGSDAIAGVVLVNPKGLKRTPGITGEVNLVGFSNGRQGNVSATIDGNLNKIPAISWRVQGTLKRGGNVRTPDYYLRNTGVSEQNFSAAVGYLKPKYGVDVFYSQFNTQVGIFSASHFGNLTDLQKAFESDRPLESADFTYAIDRPRQEIEHELFKAKAYWHTGGKGKLTFTYARQFNRRLEYDKHPPLNDSLANLNLPALQFNLTTHTSEIAWEHVRTKSFKGKIGVNGISQGNTYRGRFFIPNFRKIGAGVFWIEEWKPKDSKLALEAGVRFDRLHQQIFMWQDDEIISPSQDFMNASGTLGGVYTFTKKLSVRGNIGSAWRPPNINELFSNGLHHGAAAIEIGDPTLVTEKAVQFNASLHYQSKKWNVLIDGYYNIINDFIFLNPTLTNTLTIKGAFPTFRYEQTNAHLRGTDVTVSYTFFEQLQITTKASILRAFNTSTNEHLIQIPADRFENGIEYQFKDKTGLKNSYISFTFVTVLEQTRVPENSDFAPPPPGYTLINIAAGMDIQVKEQFIYVGLSADNLTNTRYRNYMNRFRYFADEMGTNISLRVGVPFTLLHSKSIHE